MAIGLLGMLALGGAGVAGGYGMHQRMKEENKWQSPDQMQKPTGYAANQMQQIQELLRRHNAGELNLPDEQVKQLSQMAANFGMEFKVESKPLQKFMFDAADTALFGLLPNEWRPASIGEEIHGESWTDRTAGTLGQVGGMFAGGGLLMKGGGKLLGGLKGWFGKGNAAAGAQRSWNFSQPGGLLNPGNAGLLGMPSVSKWWQRSTPQTTGLYPQGGGYMGASGPGQFVTGSI